MHSLLSDTALSEDICSVTAYFCFVFVFFLFLLHLEKEFDERVKTKIVWLVPQAYSFKDQWLLFYGWTFYHGSLETYPVDNRREEESTFSS